MPKALNAEHHACLLCDHFASVLWSAAREHGVEREDLETYAGGIGIALAGFEGEDRKVDTELIRSDVE